MSIYISVNRNLLEKYDHLVNDIPKDKNQSLINSKSFDILLELDQNGIDFLFDKCPELQSIGSKKEYLNYLKTVFPNSIYPYIVYHGSKGGGNFDTFEHKKSVNFDYNHGAFFFTSSMADAETGGTGDKNRHDEIIPVLLDIQSGTTGIIKEYNKLNINYDVFPIDNKVKVEKKYSQIDNIEKLYSLLAEVEDSIKMSIMKKLNEEGVSYPLSISIFEDRISIIGSGKMINIDFQRKKRIGICKGNETLLDLSNQMGYIGNITEQMVFTLKQQGITSIMYNVPDIQRIIGKQGYKNRFIVFQPEQIYRLGTNDDKCAFRKFIQQKV